MGSSEPTISRSFGAGKPLRHLRSLARRAAAAPVTDHRSRPAGQVPPSAGPPCSVEGRSQHARLAFRALVQPHARHPPVASQQQQQQQHGDLLQENGRTCRIRPSSFPPTASQRCTPSLPLSTTHERPDGALYSSSSYSPPNSRGCGRGEGEGERSADDSPEGGTARRAAGRRKGGRETYSLDVVAGVEEERLDGERRGGAKGETGGQFGARSETTKRSEARGSRTDLVSGPEMGGVQRAETVNTGCGGMGGQARGRRGPKVGEDPSRRLGRRSLAGKQTHQGRGWREQSGRPEVSVVVRRCGRRRARARDAP